MPVLVKKEIKMGECHRRPRPRRRGTRGCITREGQRNHRRRTRRGRVAPSAGRQSAALIQRRLSPLCYRAPDRPTPWQRSPHFQSQSLYRRYGSSLPTSLTNISLRPVELLSPGNQLRNWVQAHLGLLGSTRSTGPRPLPGRFERARDGDTSQDRAR